MQPSRHFATAKAERSKFLLTWLGWRDSNPLYRSQSPVCYHYTTSQWSYAKPRPARPASARFQWGGIWGSNPRHPEPQSGALPTELIPPNLSARFSVRPIINSKPGFEVVFQTRSPLGEAISKPVHPRLRISKLRPSEAGPISEGRKKERIRNFRRPRWKRSEASLF